jgi:hypothetical protein
MSFSFNTSSSDPLVTPTPENSILDEIARYASSLAPQMLDWARGQFAKTSQVTDQAVGNFFQASQQMTGLAGNMINQYNNLFAPENAQLVADANSYASPSRMQTDMGMAGATQAQAGDQAIKNSEQNLLSFGIDPSAGRYASLDKAAAVQNAANVAGAENMQRMQDINTGQQLRAEAVQAGSLMPGAISNAENTAIQANAGASNASLANANTGANLMDMANKYLQTAMGLKLSPVGQTSRSSGSSSSPDHGGSRSGGGGSGGGPGGGGVGGGSGGPAWMPQHGGGGSEGGGGVSGGRSGGQPGAGILHPCGGGPDDPQNPGGGGPDWGEGTGSLGNPVDEGIPYIQDPGGLGGGGITDANPFGDPGFGQTFGGGYGDVFGGQSSGEGGLLSGGGDSWGGSFGNNTYDPGANPAPSDWPSYDPSPWPDSGGGGGGDVFSQGSGQDYIGGYGGFGQDYGSSDMSGDFALGGPVGGYADGGSTTGGFVNPSLSPSGGAQTDDVNAHLNANEFVIPRDVANWKGQEFFHNLIAKSRATRNQLQAASPVGPKPAQARPGPTNFQSRRIA